MTTQFSREELLKFLDYLGDKGLMKRSTAISRKAAVNTLLSILEPDEAVDVRNINLDSLMNRFANLRQGQFKPESLSVYKSRLGSSIEEFVRWRANPTTFKLQMGTKERATKTQNNDTSKGDRQNDRQHKTPSQNGQKGDLKTPEDEVQTITFPVPIRPGVIVRVTGIPSDLTPEEAEKIGNVILALSGSQED